MTNTTPRNIKSIDFFIVALCLSIITLAILYPTERIAFSDTSGYMLELIFDRSYYIATNRYIAVICQILPIAAIWLGFSLKTVVLCYSINFALLPISCAAICRLMLKDQRTAFAILLFYLIMGSLLFYFPVTEFQMGLCLLFVIHSMVVNASSSNRFAYFFFIAILSTTVAFSHPLSTIILSIWAGWVIVAFDKRDVKLRLIFPILISAIAYFVKQNYFPTEINGVDYDTSRATGISNFTDSILANLRSPLAQSSLSVFTSHYFIALAMLLISLITMCKSKKWLVALYSLSVCCFLWLLVTVSFRDSGYDYYYEHLYQGLPFFVALFFVNFGIDIFNNRRATSLLIAPALFIVVAKVNNGHIAIESRQDFYRRYVALMKTKNIHKAALKRSYIVSGNLNSYWSSCAESLLISSLEKPESAASLYMIWNESELQPLESKIDVMAAGENYIPIAQLPKKYFNLDTTRPYVNLENIFDKQILDSLSHQQRH